MGKTNVIARSANARRSNPGASGFSVRHGIATSPHWWVLAMAAGNQGYKASRIGLHSGESIGVSKYRIAEALAGFRS